MASFLPAQRKAGEFDFRSLDTTTAADIVGGTWPRRKKSYCEERGEEDTGTQVSAVGKLSKSIKKMPSIPKSHTDLSKTVQPVLNLAVIEGLWFGFGLFFVYLFFINFM